VAFTSQECAVLLAVKGIDPTAVIRVEEMGFHSLKQRAKVAMLDVVHGAAMRGSSCWKNSPQSPAAIDGAINASRHFVAQST
jgi:hypothetical protein